ncbi:MAG: hypothetical protein IJ716_08355 [Lachnospiraceae bacterium]|nr:hypothetical protein [Lachnospiraceae bacterium]MBR1743959.1 hypothetical protein [Lachnospiraceae bacterium]
MMTTNNLISSVGDTYSYTAVISKKSTVQTESVAPTMSKEEKLDAFKKEVWDEIDRMPWNTGMNTSIQITDKAFERMMNDTDFKDRMMSALQKEAVAEQPPGDTVLIWIDDNGKKAYAYMDIEAGHQAFAAHSKDKDIFYVKKAKKDELNEAWEQARVRRQEQREYLEKKYNAEQYLKKVFAHQDEIAKLYDEAVNVRIESP